MKKIISLIILSLIFFSCSSDKIKVYIDEELSKKGILIWKEDIKFIDNVIGDVFNQPDIFIIQNKNLDLLGKYFLEKKYIHVKINNDVVIAHEFGHFLGHNDNEEYGSIMFPSYEFTNKSLLWFTEFKLLWFGTTNVKVTN